MPRLYSAFNKRRFACRVNCSNSYWMYQLKNKVNLIETWVALHLRFPQRFNKKSTSPNPHLEIASTKALMIHHRHVTSCCLILSKKWILANFEDPFVGILEDTYLFSINWINHSQTHTEPLEMWATVTWQVTEGIMSRLILAFAWL